MLDVFEHRNVVFKDRLSPAPLPRCATAIALSNIMAKGAWCCWSLARDRPRPNGGALARCQLAAEALTLTTCACALLARHTATTTIHTTVHTAARRYGMTNKTYNCKLAS